MSTNNMATDPKVYSKNRGIQERDTIAFLSVMKKMDWKKEEEDLVMEIGCGSGDSTRYLFVPFFSKAKKIIAFDSMSNMIEFAESNNADDKIEYHVADIQDKKTLERWTGSITKIISVYCLHWTDLEKSFQNIYDLLVPGGEAALIFFLWSHAWNSYECLINSSKWSTYLKDLQLSFMKPVYKSYDDSSCKHLLERIGFTVTICEMEERMYIFPDDDYVRNHCTAVSGLTETIPKELMNEFKECLFQNFVEANGRCPDGNPMQLYKTLTLLIRKPYA